MCGYYVIIALGTVDYVTVTDLLSVQDTQKIWGQFGIPRIAS